MYPYTVIKITHKDALVQSVAMFSDYDDAAAYCIDSLECWTFEPTTYIILENNQVLYKETYKPKD